MNKIYIDRDESNLALMQALGSRNKQTSAEAQEAFAAIVGPTIQQVLDQTATSNLIYTTFEYDMDDIPSIPLDLYEGNDEGLIDVWSASMPGGLATNLVHGQDEFRMHTYTLNSAVSMLKQYARKGRLDVVAKALNRMAQEILVKQEHQAWSLLLQALAAASTNGAQHILDGGTAGEFKLDDLNRLWTKVKRLRSSWVNGTPSSVPAQGLTDILVSPESMENIRAFAYNPQNTTAVPDTAESTAIPLPDSVRESVFNNAGLPELFGVNIIVLNELGAGGVYSTLFDSVYTPGGGDVGFAGATDDLILGVDRSVDAFVRVVARDSDMNSTVVAEPDDQFVTRSKKIGWFAEVEEGRAVVDNKAVTGIVIDRT